MRVLFWARGAESLGVEQLMSCLEARGHEVELLFDPGLDNNLYYRFPPLKLLNRWDRLERRARDWKPDLVAFAVPTNIYPFAREFAKRLKPAVRVPFIFGGLHPSALPEVVLRDPEVDFVCRGEGEETIVELADALAAGRPVDGIRNLCWREGGGVRVNPLRPLIADLDSLPFPKRDHFYRAGAFKTMLHVLTARGCPFSCTYCVNSFLHDKLYKEIPGRAPLVRQRSPESVVAEIRDAAARWPIDHIFFIDEILITRKEWLRRFLDLYRKECRGITFSFSYHHRFMDAEIAQWLAEAGATFAQGAIETANPALRREVLGRTDQDEDILRAVRLLREVGIKVSTSAIFGIPRETAENRWETVRLVEQSRPDMLNTYMLYPFPGTRVAELARAEGYLADAGWEDVCLGRSSYHQDSVLRNMDLDNAATVAKLLPLYVMGPRVLKPLWRALMRGRFPRLAHFLYVASVPLLYKDWALRWVANLVRMFWFRLTGRSA